MKLLETLKDKLLNRVPMQQREYANQDDMRSPTPSHSFYRYPHYITQSQAFTIYEAAYSRLYQKLHAKLDTPEKRENFDFEGAFQLAQNAFLLSCSKFDTVKIKGLAKWNLIEYFLQKKMRDYPLDLSGITESYSFAKCEMLLIPFDDYSLIVQIKINEPILMPQYYQRLDDKHDDFIQFINDNHDMTKKMIHYHTTQPNMRSEARSVYDKLMSQFQNNKKPVQTEEQGLTRKKRSHLSPEQEAQQLMEFADQQKAETVDHELYEKKLTESLKLTDYSYISAYELNKISCQKRIFIDIADLATLFDTQTGVFQIQTVSYLQSNKKGVRQDIRNLDDLYQYLRKQRLLNHFDFDRMA